MMRLNVYNGGNNALKEGSSELLIYCQLVCDIIGKSSWRGRIQKKTTDDSKREEGEITEGSYLSGNLKLKSFQAPQRPERPSSRRSHHAVYEIY